MRVLKPTDLGSVYKSVWSLSLLVGYHFVTFLLLLDFCLSFRPVALFLCNA
jgi:hypothetical protein